MEQQLVANGKPYNTKRKKPSKSLGFFYLLPRDCGGLDLCGLPPLEPEGGFPPLLGLTLGFPPCLGGFPPCGLCGLFGLTSGFCGGGGLCPGPTFPRLGGGLTLGL